MARASAGEISAARILKTIVSARPSELRMIFGLIKLSGDLLRLFLSWDCQGAIRRWPIGPRSYKMRSADPSLPASTPLKPLITSQAGVLVRYFEHDANKTPCISFSRSLDPAFRFA